MKNNVSTRQLPYPDRKKLSSRQPVLSSRQSSRHQTKRVDNSARWGKVTRQVVDVLRCPVDNFERLSERALSRNRQTQVSQTDLPFRLVRQQDGWWLVQLVDGTFGWLPERSIREVKTADYWGKVRYAPKGKLLLPSPISPAKILRELKKFEGIPYLWGGTTRRGMDCSAFVQKLFWDLGKVLLPRNSHDQKKCGAPVYSTRRSQKASVDSTRFCPLDILFFVHLPASRQARKKGRHHVGVYWDGEVVHFCLDRQGLSREPLAEMQKRYEYLATRRIFQC